MTSEMPGRLRGVPELVAAALAQETEQRASAEKVIHLLAYRERVWNDAEAAAAAAGAQGPELDVRLEAADDGVARDIEAALGPRGYGEAPRDPETSILEALDAAEWVRDENPSAWAEYVAGRTDLAWVRRTFQKARAPLPAAADPEAMAEAAKKAEAVEAELAARRSSRIRSCVLLFALGDAWGRTTEFTSDYEQLLASPPPVPQELKVTDDTQMGLCTLEAIRTLRRRGITLEGLSTDAGLQNTVRRAFADAYLEFAHDPDNDRAPGETVMTALAGYEAAMDKITGDEGADNSSLGSGTIMRTPWLGLLPYTRSTLMSLAVLQSQTTHGHPKGWAASAVLTLLVSDLLNGRVSAPAHPELLFHAVRVIDEIRDMDSPLAEAMGEDLDALERDLLGFAARWYAVERTLDPSGEQQADVNTVFGEGWTADETLFNVLGVASLYAEETVIPAIRRLVMTRGDSDSIAAVGGAVIGLQHPRNRAALDMIRGRLEPRYRKELDAAAEFLVTHHL
ncbi:ADP-ribosylglycohydrolase family protein [Nesterenkonia populi]